MAVVSVRGGIVDHYLRPDRLRPTPLAIMDEGSVPLQMRATAGRPLSSLYLNLHCKSVLRRADCPGSAANINISARDYRPRVTPT